jgi:Flp pilus assembly pilin Flp
LVENEETSMPATRQRIKGFLLDETGLELSEYALGAGFMAIAIVTAFSELGTRVSYAIASLINQLDSGN